MFVVEPTTKRSGERAVGTPGQTSAKGPGRCNPQLAIEEGSFGVDIQALIEDWLVPRITDKLIREAISQTESGDA